MAVGHPKLLAAVLALQLLCSALAQDGTVAPVPLPACRLNAANPIKSTCPAITPVYSPPLDDAVRRNLRDLVTTGKKRLTIYEDTVPWDGDDPTPKVLQAAPYNMQFNTHYFKRATSSLATLSIADTEVVWLSSDGKGTCAPNTNTRAHVGKLRSFVAAGGILIADLATNCATLAVAPLAGSAVLDLGALASYDEGPSTIPALPVDNSLATTPNNLAGLTGVNFGVGNFNKALLPLDAVVHLRGGNGKPLIASYSIGLGTVVVDNISKEMPWHDFGAEGWANDLVVVENLVRFALYVPPVPPVVVVPANAVLEAESSDGTVYEFEATSTSAVTCEPVSGSAFALGLTTVNCSATNEDGTTTESFTVTVVDTQGPVISAPSAINSQQGNTAGGATVSYNVSALDVVDGPVDVNCDKVSGTFLFPLGTSTVTCTSTDSAGHEATATFDVEVIDTDGPAVHMSATAPLEQEGDTAGGAVFTYTVTAADVVDGIATDVTCDHASGSVFPVGTTTVSCSSKDSGDRETIATIDVVVTGTTGPVITVPTIAVQEATAAGGATVTYTVSASDVVEGSTAVTCDKPSDTLFPLGNNTVTCTSTDSDDSETTAQFYVVVADTTSPVVTMVAVSSLTLVSNSAAGGAVFKYTLTAVDVVDGVDLTTTCNQASGSVLPVGNNTVTCSASDSSNNAASASLTVIVTAAPTPAPTPLVTTPAPTTSSSAIVAYTWQVYLLVLVLSAVLFRAA